MPQYQLTLYYLDTQGGETTRRYGGEFADSTTAAAARDTFVNALQAGSQARIIRADLTEVTEYAGAAPGTASVFMIAQITAELSGGVNKKYAWNLPAPIEAMFVGNTVDVTNAALLAIAAEVDGQGGDGWTISDGEGIDSLQRGRRRYVRSGTTQLD